MTEGENGSRKIGIRYEMKKKHDGSNLHISVWFNCTLLLSFELKERIMTLFKGYLCYTLGPVSLFTSKKKKWQFSMLSFNFRIIFLLLSWQIQSH